MQTVCTACKIRKRPDMLSRKTKQTGFGGRHRKQLDKTVVKADRGHRPRRKTEETHCGTRQKRKTVKTDRGESIWGVDREDRL